MGEDFRILFVCSGNRCRSVYAEHLLRNALPEGFEVRSAGTLNIPDQPVPNELIDIGRRVGLDLGGHRSIALSTIRADDDLVIGFERMHVATAVVDHGVDAGRAFTLPELGDLIKATGSSPRGPRDAIERAHELRKALGYPPPDEIVDPFRRPVSVYEAVARQIGDLCGRVAAVLSPTGTPE